MQEEFSVKVWGEIRVDVRRVTYKISAKEVDLSCGVSSSHDVQLKLRLLWGEVRGYRWKGWFWPVLTDPWG
jgi:hypothetical protein